MNEEEKFLIKMLEDCQDTYIEDVKVTKLQYTTKEAKVILDLINRQQKEIEKLKSRKYILNAETNEIKEIPISDDYISKDKIKEKIKKEKEMRYYRFLYGNNQTPLESYKFKYTEIDMNEYAGMEVNRALKELLGE